MKKQTKKTVQKSPKKETKSPIEEVVADVVGPDVIALVKILKIQQNVSEFKLAAKMKQEINTVRNMLYRLYNANLVSFIRKKDQKKGWYIYYWTFNGKQIKYIAADLKKKKAEKLSERLAREKNSMFYNCKNKCLRLEFEQAMDFEFKCPECGNLLEQEDNSLKIKTIEKEMQTIQKDISKEQRNKKNKK